ncbi:hypothetical protein ACFFJB_06325 [Camelimonas abortus]|uniref:Uncharacterized protein n=1 Tax=Camelimonas abortus TaxID=1017184 RepID=A0ABV7LCJ1_9HYPH
MTVRRLSRDALVLVLACLTLGTLVLARTTMRAWSEAGAALREPAACGDPRPCLTPGRRSAAPAAPAVTGPGKPAVAAAIAI